MKRILKKLLGKNIVQWLKALYLLLNKKTINSTSIANQLEQWQSELTTKHIKQLLRHGEVDSRMLIPTIIFQSGKVGSTSVHESLKKKNEDIGISTPIFHAHVLEGIDQRIELIQKVREKPDNSISKLLESKALREQMDDHAEWSWNVISLVRDPVALRVSAFFQLLDEYIPDWQSQFADGELTLERLQKIFFKKGGLKIGGRKNWFDAQIKPIWGIDIFSIPFSKEKGFQIYTQNPKINLMIIRLEDLNSAAEEAFNEFMGMKNFSIIKVNIGANKPYSHLYKQFKELPLPTEGINDIYNSRYARYFYTDNEIKAFKRRWLQEK